MKKPVRAFIPADQNNKPYADQLISTIRKFHSEKELPIEIVDNPNPQDTNFWYRATPIIAKKFIKDYELVLKLDADMLCFGNLDHIIKRADYEVGTVLNINRVDPPTYGLVEGWAIPPNEYYNCGLVAMRSERFVDEFYRLCHTKYFERFRYREQDILNLLAHFGGFTTVCFDHQEKGKQSTWNGLVAKGETLRGVIKEKELIIPKGEDNYPNEDTTLKIWHTAAGSGEKKVNYRIHFNEEGIKFIEELIK